MEESNGPSRLPPMVDPSEHASSNGDSSDSQKNNRIQVSSVKKPLFFYVNLAKKYLQQHEEVELSALGTAIATSVTVAEILKNNQLAIEKKISTSIMAVTDEEKDRIIHKPKVSIILVKSCQFDELMAAEHGDELDYAEEVD